jgi:hypothetical protein
MLEPPIVHEITSECLYKVRKNYLWRPTPTQPRHEPINAESAKGNGKALTDGMFTTPFSITPLSANRNYSVNIPSVRLSATFNTFCQHLSSRAYVRFAGSEKLLA